MAINELIDRIVNKEWNMPDQVRNMDGRASCKNAPQTFRIMRSTQFMTWPENLLQRYPGGLKKAEDAGRNLISEKYAFMMGSTAPDEFEDIRHSLSMPGVESLAQIREIVDIHVNWERATDAAYPHIRAQGRPLTKDQDGPGVTSFETCLTGELKTWSEATLNG